MSLVMMGQNDSDHHQGGLHQYGVDYHHGGVHQYGDNDDREQAPVVVEPANLWPHYPPSSSPPSVPPSTVHCTVSTYMIFLPHPTTQHTVQNMLQHTALKCNVLQSSKE